MNEETDDRSELLSVVVIARNEEERIETCLESIFTVCEGVIPFEVIIVDSNSTDRTVDIAAKRPVDIYVIEDEKVTSPAAGRYVGARFAEGDYLFFVDGDMEVVDGWVGRAIDLLRDCPAIGGVSGSVDDAERPPEDGVRTTPAFDGHGIFTAAAYHEAGGFDPAIRGSEDYELCYRITDTGYALVELPTVTVRHPLYRGGGVVGAVTDVIRRSRSGYTVGIGQVFRKHATDPVIVATHATLHRSHVVQMLWLLCSVPILGLSAGLFGVWLLATGLTVIAVTNRAEESWPIALWELVRTATETVGILIGLVGSPPDEVRPMEAVSRRRTSSLQPHDGQT